MRLARLQTTPVKGLRLHPPRHVTLGTEGAADDRRFYLIDDKDRLVNGRRYGPLAQVNASYDAARHTLRLDFPDGSVAEAIVSVTDDGVATNFFDHDVAGHVVEGPWAKALSMYSGLDLRLIAVDHPGTGIDLYPVTVITTASIQFLQNHAPADIRIDHRRFRMLIEVEGCEPFDEDAWEGRELTVGPARLQVAGPVPRCLVTRQNPETGEKDYDTLQAIMKTTGRPHPAGVALQSDGTPGIFFGRYATVATPGELALGDQITLI